MKTFAWKSDEGKMSHLLVIPDQEGYYWVLLDNESEPTIARLDIGPNSKQFRFFDGGILRADLLFWIDNKRLEAPIQRRIKQ